MFGKLLILVFTAVAFLLAFDATALAANAADTPSPLDLLEQVYRAFAHGEYWYAGAMALVVLAATARKFGGDRLPFLRTEAGTAGLLLVGSFGASLVARLAGGVTMTTTIGFDAVKNAVCAAGGYAVVKSLIVDPLLVPLTDKYPRIAQPLRLLTALFDTGGAKPEPAPEGK